jgi:hypothetical protein
MNLPLSTEQIDVLAANASANNQTPEEFVLQWINHLVASARAQAATNLQRAADALPYEKRQELIQTVQAFIQANV